MAIYRQRVCRSLKVYYASILHTIYKIKDATFYGGIFYASFALQSC